MAVKLAVEVRVAVAVIVGVGVEVLEGTPPDRQILSTFTE